MATLPIQPGETHVFLGDSTTNGDATTSWWAGAGFFVAQVNAQIATDAPSPRFCVNASAKCVNATTLCGNSSAPQPPIVALNSGVNGATTGSLISSFASLVTAKTPRFIWLSIGINDIVAAVPVATYSANVATLLSMINGVSPLIKIAVTFIPCQGEVWHMGPLWGVNSPDFDATIDQYNAAIVTCVAAAANPCIAVDFRTQLLAWEVINNPSKLALGVATQDGRHWNDTGRTAAAAFALPSVVVG